MRRPAQVWGEFQVIIIQAGGAFVKRKIKKAETMEQLETAKIEVEKPFAFEDELKEKSERLNALNIELNLDQKDPAVLDAEPEQNEEPPERKCAGRER